MESNNQNTCMRTRLGSLVLVVRLLPVFPAGAQTPPPASPEVEVLRQEMRSS
jgi:hypothetical protein